GRRAALHVSVFCRRAELFFPLSERSSAIGPLAAAGRRRKGATCKRLADDGGAARYGGVSRVDCSRPTSADCG
ncbi:hypothetical protein, partial [Asanoa siamensis]|uniref:hypothetical protein n=1 Tax=Asanoa siamensis TaxID=926357 RepID=UPI0019411C01